MRAWRFSSVTSSLTPLKALARARRYLANTGVIGRRMNSMPRFRASRAASRRVPPEENGDGMVTPVTLAGPRASQAMAATRAESMPPDSPITA